MPRVDIPKFMRNRQRLSCLPVFRRLRYAAGVLHSEVLGLPRLGTLGLRVVEISLTDRCQCRCDHCYSSCGMPFVRSHEPSTEDVQGILDQIAEMGIPEVSFEGGEPLLRRDLPELVAYARGLGLVPKINTNGLLLDEAVVIQLKHAGLTWAMVSLDSADPVQHDRHRGFHGCHVSALQGIGLLRRQGIPASIVTCVRRDSLESGDFSRLLSLGRELRANAIRVLLPVWMGSLDEAELLSLEERQEVRRLARGSLVAMENPSEGSRCMAGITKLNITTSGDVTPCSMLPLTFGNVRRSSLREIWRAMASFAAMPKPQGQCPTNDPGFRKEYMPRLSAAHSSPPGR